MVIALHGLSCAVVLFSAAFTGSADDFVMSLLRDPKVFFSMLFLVCSLLGGVRILVENDPLGDILDRHDPISPGRDGRVCPRCGDRRIRVNDQTLMALCRGCGFQWRPGQPSFGGKTQQLLNPEPAATGKTARSRGRLRPLRPLCNRY